MSEISSSKTTGEEIVQKKERFPKGRKPNSKRMDEGGLFREDILNTPCYDEGLMKRVTQGIAMNIYIEMDKQGIGIREICDLSGISVSHLSRILSNKTSIGLDCLIKISYALNVNLAELIPYDLNKRKTNGERFDDITKGLDVTSCNFLLGVCADMVKEMRRLKHM